MMDLYELLSHIFGTKEYVRIRRQLVFLRENFLNYYYNDAYLSVICSGSLGEGVAYPPSDDDLMMCYTSTRVVRSYRDATQRNDLLMVPSADSPGYCLLFDVNQSYNAAIKHVINEMQFLSSFLWKQINLKEGESLHGPCGSRIVGVYEYDNAHCIPCSFWPDVANNWILRNRLHSWPSCEIINNIVINGCHVVPIGNPTSSFCQHEWRLSFSLAERKLFHSFNHLQFLTYNLLRLCLKRVIEKAVPGVLCSYFMKTTLFYTSENTPVCIRRENNTETCFKVCLSVLYDYVEQRYCPNFFIPEYNMIKWKLNDRNRHKLLDIIRYLHSVKIVGILELCGESLCVVAGSIWTPFFELRLDFQFMQSSMFHLTIEALYKALLKLPIDAKTQSDILCKMLNLMERNSMNPLSSIFFRRENLFCCQKLINCLSCSLQTNKNSYGLNKTIELLLRIGYNADLTTGKLITATYMYLIGKTESALSHIRLLLSQHPPYAFDHKMSVLQLTTYVHTMCSRGYTTAYKLRNAFAPVFHLHRDTLNAFPMPPRIWISTCTEYLNIIDSLSYTYFLESLCHIGLKNHVLLMKSTKYLVSHLNSLPGDYCKIWALMIIGIAKYAQGDSQSECRWFGAAFAMKDNIPSYIIKDLSYSILTYIACLLNREFLTKGVS